MAQVQLVDINAMIANSPLTGGGMRIVVGGHPEALSRLTTFVPMGRERPLGIALFDAAATADLALTLPASFLARDMGPSKCVPDLDGLGLPLDGVGTPLPAPGATDTNITDAALNLGPSLTTAAVPRFSAIVQARTAAADGGTRVAYGWCLPMDQARWETSVVTSALETRDRGDAILATDGVVTWSHTTITTPRPSPLAKIRMAVTRTAAHMSLPGGAMRLQMYNPTTANRGTFVIPLQQGVTIDSIGERDPVAIGMGMYSHLCSPLAIDPSRPAIFRLSFAAPTMAGMHIVFYDTQSDKLVAKSALDLLPGMGAVWKDPATSVAVVDAHRFQLTIPFEPCEAPWVPVAAVVTFANQPRFAGLFTVERHGPSASSTPNATGATDRQIMEQDAAFVIDITGGDAYVSYKADEVCFKRE